MLLKNVRLRKTVNHTNYVKGFCDQRNKELYKQSIFWHRKRKALGDKAERVRLNRFESKETRSFRRKVFFQVRRMSEYVAAEKYLTTTKSEVYLISKYDPCPIWGKGRRGFCCIIRVVLRLFADTGSLEPTLKSQLA